MAFATGWSNPLKGWVGQESVTVQWHCYFQFIFRLDLWRDCLAFSSSCNTNSLSQGHFLEINDWLELTVSAPPCWSLVPGNALVLWFPMAPIDVQHSCENINPYNSMERTGKIPGKSPSREIFPVGLATATLAAMTAKPPPSCLLLGIPSNILDQPPV